MTRIPFLGFVLAGAVLVSAGCYSMRPSAGAGQTGFSPPRKINAADVALPRGYAIEPIAIGLTFPTGITFDAEGAPVVVESGYSYGEVFTEPRLLRIESNGQTRVLARGENDGPWTGVTFHAGSFFVAAGDVRGNGKILRIGSDGQRNAVVSGLPSRGDHHTNGPIIGPDGWLYFAQGTATNSGVVGEDNAKFGWLSRFPDFHDVPGQDITLAGVNFTSANPSEANKSGQQTTGAFLPFGTPSQSGQVIKGEVKCSGGILRVRPEGGEAELIAWGFRNPFGLAFSPAGKLFVTENGFDDRGSRPVWGKTSGPEIVVEKDATRDATATAYTTRLPAGDAETQAVLLAQTVYGATREENSAGAIILCAQDEHLAFTAMQRITHMPVNAPLLYLAQDGSLSEKTKREMKRLNPDGVVQDGRVQVYVVGRASAEVLRTVREDLKYEVEHFPETDPVALAETLDRWQAALKSDHPDEIVISAIDHPEGIAYGMGAMGWNAHMGKGFAWVKRDSVPEQTLRIVARRFGRGGAYLYLTGGPDVISDEVAHELSRYGLVRRIQGADMFAANVTNAGYKDFGRDLGWWWGWSSRSFGWGIAQAGHNFIIVDADHLLGAIPAAVLGHMGKHGPILLVRTNEVPESVTRYLEMVRPFRSGPTATIRNHAWIIGDENRLSLGTRRFRRLTTARRSGQRRTRHRRRIAARHPGCAPCRSRRELLRAAQHRRGDRARHAPAFRPAR